MLDKIYSEQKLAGTLADDLVYKTLLESTLAIPWKIDWASQTYKYVGPQIEKLLGWKQDTWKTVEDWATRMHPDDQQSVVAKCVEQCIAGIDHEADYRALMANGEYLWIREVVHVVRNEQGEVDSLVGFMFDISERKKQELELEKLRAQLEAYSYQDGLTGIANRRLFNEIFQREWLSAIRSQTQFSMILLDVDYFKNYNDCYGHIQGDVCLQQMAEILKYALTRPRDMVARFGGEEFAIILPETDEQAASEIAERLVTQVVQAKIPHQTSMISPYVTVSLGVKTSAIQEFDDRLGFLKDLDRALYRAKESGRNGYCCAQRIGREKNTSIQHRAHF